MKPFSMRLLAALVLSTTFASSAIADDLNPPPWVRGSSRTTSQEWKFNSPTDIFGGPVTDQNGTFGNPYGQPYVIDPGQYVWLPDDSGFNPTNPNPRTGVVCIGSDRTLKFFIPNEPHPELQKLIWVQLTWWAAPGTNVVVSPLAPAPNTGSIVGTSALGGGWNHTTASFVLEHQPPFEEFWIQNFTSSPIYIDQLVIDTKCVPEPGALAVVAVGVALLAVRRRKA